VVLNHPGQSIVAAELVVALFASLIVIHTFVDGKKRVAFFATDVFLRLPGYKPEVDA
jgi:prophage maintenance system killer protein